MHTRGFMVAILGLLTAGPGCGSVVGVDPEGGSTTAASPEEDSTGVIPVDPTVPPPPPGSTSGEPEPGTTTDWEGSSGSCAFLPSCGDSADTDVSYECDLFEQSCPEGEKCMPWANDGGSSWNATRCVPIDANPDGLYEPCTVEGSGVSGIDSCELGAMCWNVDEETLVGTCVGLCTGSQNAPGCADENAQCSISGDGVLTLCLPNCDPLDAEACPPGEGCYPFYDAFTCFLDISGPKAGGAGEPCESINGCDPGLLCAHAGDVGACEPGAFCCTPYCDLAEPVCPEGLSCLPYYLEGEAPAGFESVGICGLEGV